MIEKRLGGVFWALVIVLLAVVAFVYYPAFENLVERWTKQEEYSHGFLIPVISMYFVWIKRSVIAAEEFQPSWSGVPLLLMGIVLLVVGELSSIYIFIQYSFILVLFGLVLSVAGVRVFRHLFIPLSMLVFAIPLPYFIDSALSWRLQLLSSQLGVYVIRLFDISVFLEGNIIDLGVYRLQVVDACSGLRYLFPLMSLGFIAAYLYKAPLWQRLVIFISTIPITVLMNSLRIGIIGVLVNYWGIEMAEGFLHDFEGWIIFMACSAVLVLEMWLLTFLRSEKVKFMDVFGIAQEGQYRPLPQNIGLPSPFLTSSLFLFLAAVFVFSITNREELVPVRKQFNEFPRVVSGWQAQQEALEDIIQEKLGFDDYFMANYSSAERTPINLYMAYYASQRKGVSPHSPRVCIPGGGWEIVEIETTEIKLANGDLLPINKVLIERGDIKQLVLYWFQQRGRLIANEYLMKWYLLWDAIAKDRTDGALVRLTALLDSELSRESAEQEMIEFIDRIYPLLPGFIPD